MSRPAAYHLLDNIQKQLDVLKANLNELPHLDAPEPFAELDAAPVSWEAFNAIQDLLESTAALESLFTPTKVKLLQVLSGIYDSSSMHAVSHFKVADKIKELEGDEQGSGITIERLAEAVGTTAIKLDPILSHLSSTYIFRQVSPGVYSNNRHSVGLLQDVRPNPSSYIAGMMIETKDATSGTIPVMSDPKRNTRLEAAYNPFAETHPGSLGFFDWVMNHASPESVQRMILGPEWLITITIDGISRDCPWGEFDDAHVVDIGCVFKLLFRFILTGDGERMLKIGPLYPNIKKITFQDNNADVLSATKACFDKDWPKNLSTALEFQQSDYFEPFQPYPRAVQGPLVFFLRAVLCDFADEDVLRILVALKPALEERKDTASGAFILIHDLFIPSEGPSPVDREQVAGDVQNKLPVPGWRRATHFTERQCTTLLGGAQRSMVQMIRLLNDAGYKVLDTYKHRTMVSTIRAGLE